jgi:hypothetical protein
MFFTSLFISTTYFAQEKQGEKVLLNQEVIDSVNYSGVDLSTEIKNWFGTFFKNADEVITSETQNQFIGRYISSTNAFGAKISFYHSLTIEIKDGRVRVTDILTEQSGGASSPARWFYKNNGKARGMYDDSLNDLVQQSNSLIENLKTHLSGNSNDDW